MSKNILRELPELVQKKVIQEADAQRIVEYYQQKEFQAPNRLVIVFGILGALLTGMGIILIIAHNWDDLSKFSKLFFALLPLLIGQTLCGFTLIKKQDSLAWREASAVFLVFGIAASISIVSQVYNIHGTLAGFLLIWMVLSIPIIYVMQSGTASLLVIAGVTWYACEVSYFHYTTAIAWYYWPMMASVIPFYAQLSKKEGNNFFYFHSWLFAISFIITLGMFGRSEEEFLFIAYMSMFSLFVLISEKRILSKGKFIANAFLISGSLGIVFILLMLSFDWFWKELANSSLSVEAEFYASIIVSLIALSMLIRLVTKKGLRYINANGYVFLIFILLFAIGMVLPDATRILINILVLVIAILAIRKGAVQDRLLILNYGLLIITALILCRFFDTHISFVIRGALFIAVGFGFFGANYWMVKRRRKISNP